MNSSLNHFLLAFIPIFVAVDALGVLPFFLSLTEGLTSDERRRVVRQCVITAIATGLGFLVLGKLIFHLLGIWVADFKIAGGIIILVLAIADLLFPEKTKRTPDSSLGIVPLGTPLIAGPAVLTTILILVDVYGYPATIFSLVVNLGFVWFVFSRADHIIRILGEGGAKGVAKVASLLLAAIAVMMIRNGIMEIVTRY